MAIRRIDKNIGTVSVWGDDNFDANVHENFSSLKEIVPQINNSIDDINQLTQNLESNVGIVNQKALETSENATIAVAAKEAAIIAKNEAQSLYDNFDDRYLGPFLTPPTLDNDGQPLKNGALYYLYTESPEDKGKMYIYDLQRAEWIDISYIPTLFSSLTDILFAGLETGDILKYNKTLGKWQNIHVASTDNAIPKYKGPNGELQDSTVFITAEGLITGTAVTQHHTDTSTGKLLKNGDFGIGNNLYINSGSCNALTISATYLLSSTLVTDTPSSGLYFIDVYKSTESNIITQIARKADVLYIWSRNFNGTTWSSWVSVYTQNNIVGAVSQTGGVPTGAIIERGSNANGEYTKFADGTLIEYKYITIAATANTLVQQTVTFPVSMSNTGGTSIALISASNTYGYLMPQPPAFNGSYFYFTTNTTQIYTFVLTKISRWF